MHPAVRSDASLHDVLAERARRASDTRLAADVAGGVVAAAAVLFWRPGPWVILLSAALCFVAFGAWGMADRSLATAPNIGRRFSRRALRTLRALAATLGAIAGVMLAVSVVALGFGHWIS